MNSSIINEAIDYGIANYLQYKENEESYEFSDFFVVVIRLLCIIFGEENIVKPYEMKNEADFDSTLCQYGFELDKALDFKEQLDKAYESLKKDKTNPFFINIQKVIIDMLMTKKDNHKIPESDINSFYDLLYTPENKNPLQLSYNFMNCTDPWEVDRYFKEQMVKHIVVDAEAKKVVLNPEAYKIFGLSVDQIDEMSADYLSLINHQIYLHFGIKEDAVNKEYLLDEAIEKLNREPVNLSSGNGYVDILLVLGILCTIGLVLTVIVAVVK